MPLTSSIIFHDGEAISSGEAHFELSQL